MLLLSTVALVSCTTPKETASLVDDPNSKHESTVPWNKPEQWESGGQLANMTDRR